MSPAVQHAIGLQAHLQFIIMSYLSDTFFQSDLTVDSTKQDLIVATLGLEPPTFQVPVKQPTGHMTLFHIPYAALNIT